MGLLDHHALGALVSQRLADLVRRVTRRHELARLELAGLVRVGGLVRVRVRVRMRVRGRVGVRVRVGGLGLG